MTDQDRANAFIARLQGKAVVSHHPLTSHQTKPTNLTPQRKAKIAVNQTRQRGINQQESHGYKIGKRDPVVVHSVDYYPKPSISPADVGPSHYDPERHYRRATKPERLRALVVNEGRRQNRFGTLTPEHALAGLQSENAHNSVRIPAERHFFHTPTGETQEFRRPHSVRSQWDPYYGKT